MRTGKCKSAHLPTILTGLWAFTKKCRIECWRRPTCMSSVLRWGCNTLMVRNTMILSRAAKLHLLLTSLHRLQSCRHAMFEWLRVGLFMATEWKRKTLATVHSKSLGQWNKSGKKEDYLWVHKTEPHQEHVFIKQNHIKNTWWTYQPHGAQAYAHRVVLRYCR